MNLKYLVAAASAAIALNFTSAANAGPSLAECLSTDIVEFDGTIVDAAIATPALSTLVDAVVAAGLGDALAETDNITVYAPTNDAFAAIPADITNTILGDTDLLTAVLTYHVSPGMHDPRRYVTPVRRTTLQGQNVFFSRNGNDARVNQAAVDCQGVKASNGMVWVIGSVLLPSL